MNIEKKPNFFHQVVCYYQFNMQLFENNFFFPNKGQSFDVTLHTHQDSLRIECFVSFALAISGIEDGVQGQNVFEFKLIIFTTRDFVVFVGCSDSKMARAYKKAIHPSPVNIIAVDVGTTTIACHHFDRSGISLYHTTRKVSCNFQV